MNTCEGGYCMRCHGVKKLVFGALLLLNAFVWPQWLGLDGWVAWVAVLIVVGGLLKLLWPTCGHCSSGMKMMSSAPMKSAGKKRRRRK